LADIRSAGSKDAFARESYRGVGFPPSGFSTGDLLTTAAVAPPGMNQGRTVARQLSGSRKWHQAAAERGAPPPKNLRQVLVCA
jgi:hypothetical protein